MGKEEQEEYFGYFMCNGKKKKAASLWEISKVSEVSVEQDMKGILREEVEDVGNLLMTGSGWCRAE